MKYETKDYHIGIIINDDIQLLLTKLTCQRCGVRISSVYQALSGKKGIQTPYDLDSYKLLWKVWTAVRRMKCPDEAVANARQIALNAIKDELEWLEFGNKPIYLPNDWHMLTNVDVAEDGSFSFIEDDSERLQRLQNLIDGYLQGKDETVNRKEAAGRAERMANYLLANDDDFKDSCNDEYSFQVKKHPNITFHDVVIDMVHSLVMRKTRLTLRARYDERPTYDQKLDKGVTNQDKRDSLSGVVRNMLECIIDVKPLTDAVWRQNVEQLIVSTLALLEASREAAKVKDGDVHIPHKLVQDFSDKVTAATGHTLRDHHSE